MLAPTYDYRSPLDLAPSEVAVFPHHQRVIERLRERFDPNPANLALVVVGSVARGEAREDSDVDGYLVVTDDEYARRVVARDMSFDGDDPVVQAGGPIVDLAFLRDAASRGPEPARFAFVGAFAAFSK